MNKLFLSIFLFLIYVHLFAQSVFEKQQAFAAVEIFFKGFHTGDTLLMQAVIEEGAMLKSVSSNAEGETTISEMLVSALIKAVANRPPTEVWEEKLSGHTTFVDGPLAVVWTPYEFWRNGRLSHCGANLFVLTQASGGWKIQSITDSRRKADCETVKD
ncbi:MAG: nuclear transport factor 2 family protein [Flavobacteriaceae bacterium]|nr:nuclear transport factor 2 family protein [Flavobacteriaceae bacterium]